MEIFAPILTAINDKKLSQPTDKARWVEVSDRVSVHAKGIRPAFRSPRKTSGAIITPASYDSRYKYLFDDYILNRHPNEAEEHYNWRLSTFPLIAQEIYLNAKSQILGAIFQTSQYTLQSNDEADNEYLDSIEFDKWFTSILPEHIFTDPYGLVAVVEGHNEEFTQNEKARPAIEMVESRFIMAYEKNESLIFQASALYRGKKVIYFLDRDWSFKFVEVKKNEYAYLSGYQHGMGILPVMKNEESFFQTFVSWADMLGRNVSDDEVIAKNASYPIREITAPKCGTCMGSCKISRACDPCEANNFSGVEYIDCTECGGQGTISINPGDTLYTKERESNDQRPQTDRVRFYNPDISINDFSFKRWQKIYEFGMRSMHMKFSEEAQSGTAKAIDREQLYFLITNVKNKLFEIGEGTLKLIISYLRFTTPSQVTNINIDAPQQFQIKTEYDIQEEYTDLLSKGADVMVRRAKLDEYMNKAFYGNTVALRKYDIIKRWDFLYGMTDGELQTRKLLGSARTVDFVKHDRAESLLAELVQTNTTEWLLGTDINAILAALDAAIAPLLPAEGVVMPV